LRKSGEYPSPILTDGVLNWYTVKERYSSSILSLCEFLVKYIYEKIHRFMKNIFESQGIS